MTHELDIRNIGGIRSGEAKIETGLNVVKAENWQGKSSFITALQVVMGATGMDGESHPLTDGASEGRVTLQTPTDTYETRLVRDGTTVRREGDVVLDDEQDRTCAHLFAFLGEDNPVRAAVRNDGDLAQQLTRPLEMENIDEQIARLQTERRSVETELDRAVEAAEQLPSKQSKIERLKDEIDDLEAERDELLSEGGAEDEAHDELSDKRAQSEQLANQIGTVENKIERLESRLQERQAELEDIEIPDEPELGSEIETKQARVSELDSTITLLEDLYRVNKRIVDEGKADVVTDVEHTLAGDELSCWVCGNETSDAQVEAKLDAIRTRIQDCRSERSSLREEIEEIQDQRDEIKRREREKRDLEREIKDLEVSLEENRSRYDDLTARLEDTEAELETLRETVDATNSQITDYESEIKYKRAELADEREELDRLETRAAQREQLQGEHDDLSSEIETLRTRRKEKKRELATQFEAMIVEIIDTFELGIETARLTPKTDSEGRITDYELVVARDGQETSLQALSEGELELLGIVTAIAGYETFEVGERVPMILLDGLTALSSANYHALVEYLRDETDLLVATAVPEIDEFDGHVVSPQQWDVVSNRQSSAT